MADYISREAAIKEIKAHICFACPFKSYSCTPEKCGTNAALKAISEIPAADVRPVVRGTWESGAQDFQTGYTHTCSVCGGFINMYVGGAEDDYNFCPNCGADMREREENEV